MAGTRSLDNSLKKVWKKFGKYWVRVWGPFVIVWKKFENSLEKVWKTVWKKFGF